MATKLSVSLPKTEITFSGVTVERKCNGVLHGRIRIRQNYIDWLPSGSKKVYRVKWQEFAELAEERNRRKRQAMTFVKAKAAFA
jgi:recombinational DNA repair ATPase RecF